MRPRSALACLFALAFAASGCGRDCLPEPSADATPPDVRLTVSYVEAATGRQATRTGAVGDTTVAVDADAGTLVRVVYAAADSAGMRGLLLGATFQLTAGMGVHHQARRIPPVTASCPRAELTGEASFPGGGERRDLILSAAAENWAGRRAVTPDVVVRFRLPPRP